MYLDRMPAFLTWTRDHVVAETVVESYVAVLSERLAGLIAFLQRRAAPERAQLRVELEGSSDRALFAVLAAPLTSHLMLRMDEDTAINVARHLIASLRLERRRDGDAAAVDATGWSACGDTEWRAGGAQHAWPEIAGLTVDYGSPHARTIDLTGELTMLATSRDAPPLDWVIRVAGGLRAAVAGIGAVSSGTRAFVTTFNRVVIVQPNPDGGKRFSSGSTRRFIGRSTLGNPDTVSPAEIASALIHEGIHSLLYMQSISDEWVSAGIDPALRVTSPWTHVALEIEPFLQACFVWYGLLHFWSLASATGVFSDEDVNTWIERCAAGFLSGSLVDVARTAGDAITPRVLTTIDALQQRIVERTAPQYVRSKLH